MKHLSQNLLLLFAVIIITAAPLIGFNKNAGEKAAALFLGADEQAVSVIEEISPGYEPWFTPLWEPPSSEIQSLLFAVQAALGAGFIGYYLGLSRHKNKRVS